MEVGTKPTIVNAHFISATRVEADATIQITRTKHHFIKFSSRNFFLIMDNFSGKSVAKLLRTDCYFTDQSKLQILLSPLTRLYLPLYSTLRFYLLLDHFKVQSLLKNLQIKNHPLLLVHTFLSIKLFLVATRVFRL